MDPTSALRTTNESVPTDMKGVPEIFSCQDMDSDDLNEDTILADLYRRAQAVPEGEGFLHL